VRACPGCRWTGRKLCNIFIYKYEGVCEYLRVCVCLCAYEYEYECGCVCVCVCVCMSMWALVIVCAIAHSC
jgi:hypothetical protein